MNKKVILDHLKLGTITLETNDNVSDCWKFFKLLYFGGKVLPGAVCNKCTSLYKYTVETGNRSLNKHVEKCSGNSNDMKLDSFFKSNKPVSQAEKDSYLDTQVKFTTKTCNSFAINGNNGLYSFA